MYDGSVLGARSAEASKPMIFSSDVADWGGAFGLFWLLWRWLLLIFALPALSIRIF